MLITTLNILNDKELAVLVIILLKNIDLYQYIDPALDTVQNY